MRLVRLAPLALVVVAGCGGSSTHKMDVTVIGNEIRPDLEKRWNDSLAQRGATTLKVRVDSVECIKLSDTKAQCVAKYRGVIANRVGSQSTDTVNVNYDPSTGKFIFTAGQVK